jgi:hypothetical protein
MAVTQTLRMTFLSQGNKNVTLSLDNPREDVTAAEVQATLDLIIARKIGTSSGGDLVSTVHARIMDTTTTELFGS